MLRREIRNYPFLFFMSLKSAFEMKKGVKEITKKLKGGDAPGRAKKPTTLGKSEGKSSDPITIINNAVSNSYAVATNSSNGAKQNAKTSAVALYNLALDDSNMATANISRYLIEKNNILLIISCARFIANAANEAVIAGYVYSTFHDSTNSKQAHGFAKTVAKNLFKFDNKIKTSIENKDDIKAAINSVAACRNAVAACKNALNDKIFPHDMKDSLTKCSAAAAAAAAAAASNAGDAVKAGNDVNVADAAYSAAAAAASNAGDAASGAKYILPPEKAQKKADAATAAATHATAAAADATAAAKNFSVYAAKFKALNGSLAEAYSSLYIICNSLSPKKGGSKCKCKK
jgi:hypothetical protein